MDFEEWWSNEWHNVYDVALQGELQPKDFVQIGWNAALQNQWRPIESAPKDGTLIDLWAECWDANGKMVFRRIPNCHWYEDKNRSGWVGLYSAEYPTHWMPIPEPPEEK